MLLYEELPLEARLSISKICESFENDWKSDKEPELEDYLQGTDASFRTALNQELEILDLHYRSKIPPKSIGRFEVERIIGEGGNGRVYLSEDPDLKRNVAIKVPLPGLGVDLNSFLSEAKKVVCLDHPNIVPVYETGFTEESVPFVVSKFIDGDDLSVHLKNETLPITEAIQILLTIAEAVTYIHEQKIIHRDIKPSNILVDREGIAYLADFGIAKNTEATATIDGKIRGTLAYMSPEQTEGNSSKITEQSDIYSMGVILYEILCGTIPFKGEMYSLIDQIRNDDPIEPRKVVPEIPLDLEAVCLIAIAKDPRRRYATAREFADDLRNAIEGRPVRARKPSRIEKSLQLVKRNPLVSTLAFLLVGCFAALGFAMSFSSNMEEPDFETVVATTNTKTVHITTNPPGARIVFVRLDKTTGKPVTDGIFQPLARTPVDVELEPGLYWIEAEIEGRGFHEVFRTVPRTVDQPRPFNHLNWTVRNDDLIELPLIEIKESNHTLKNTTKFQAGSYRRTDGSVISFVKEFYLSQTEVTVGEYRDSGMKNNIGAKLDRSINEPVNYVSWDQAVAYAEKSGMRLPTIAEFIYAATNRSTSKFPWGEDESYLKTWHYGQVRQSGYDQLLSEPSVHGLYSNVAEWTMSWFITKFKLPPSIEASLPHSRLVAGGGSSVFKNDPTFRKVASGVHKENHIVIRYLLESGLGFRCCRSSDPRFLNK